MVIAHLTQQAARNCRNKEIKDKIGKGRRLEYGNNEQKRTIEKENR